VPEQPSARLPPLLPEFVASCLSILLDCPAHVRARG
jgi:hypothetical protein